jgi:hypothetical protein
MAITSAKRQQLGDRGSLNRKATYMDNVQRAVEGRLMALITQGFS